MRTPRTLTARLVVTAVALVAIVSVLIATIATLAIHTQLIDQLDKKVVSAGQRFAGENNQPPSGGGGYPPPDPGNQGPGTLLAFVDSTTSTGVGRVLTERRGNGKELSSSALKGLADIPTDGQIHSIDLAAVGHYRVTARKDSDGVLRITGQPTRDVDQTVASLIWLEALLILGGLGVAALSGTILVRRQLRPLREVAETAHRVSDLPLSEGAIDLDERVPERLTDERTEVGQVGAALNTLLNHVEDSLGVRHRSEQQVRQFVADASHELRTPLTTIQGYAELSRRTPDDPVALSGALAKVETETHRMASLVEDLLLLARLDAGRPLEREEVDLTRLLLESVADARVVDAEHHWRLRLPDEPVSVQGDEQRLHQLFTNLLGNARHHTPPGTTVTVGAELRDRVVVARISDDGPGLPSGLSEHAFERFTRGDSSRTRASGGAGLGLSLVSAIAIAHGGHAEVSSVPGETTFEITLPLG